MAVFFDGRCACGREVCDFTCMTYAAYIYMQNNIGMCQERIKKESITNADRIRSMTDKELAHTLWLTAKGGIIGQRSEDEWLDWLRQENE